MVLADAADLCTFVDQSPTPFHVCATVAAELDAAGLRHRLDERDEWPSEPGRYYVVRGGSLDRLVDRVERQTRRRAFASSAVTPTARTSGSSSTTT